MKILFALILMTISTISFAGETKKPEPKELPLVCYNGPEPECRMVE